MAPVTGQGMKQLRPTSAHVDLELIQANLAAVRAKLPSGTRVLAAVKGNAYGHGAARCAAALAQAGVDWFGVALVEEGRQLRAAGITEPILCMGGAGPFGAEEAIAHELTPLVSHIEEAEALNAAAGKAGVVAKIHIKVDTGMGRLGVPLHHWAHFLDRVADLTNLEIEGLATHLAQSESSDGDVATLEQLRRFREADQQAADRGFRIPIRHAANSGAIINHPDSCFDMVRPGLLLYGYDPGQEAPRVEVAPAMSVTTQVLVVRDLPAGVGVSYGGEYITKRPSRIATLPVGYADGYPRSLSDSAWALIHGHRVPLRGRVCMDMCMVDVTDVPVIVRPGDEVVLLGRQQEESIDAWQLASWANTIPYVVLTGFSERIPRRS